jgi:hypothetical protein
MKKIHLYLLISALVVSFTSCELLSNALSSEDAANGLKEALKVGTDSSTTRLNKTNGFLGDAAVKILLPDEATAVANTLNTIIPGVTDQLITKINRAAESAASEAKPIFWNAITQMTIQDALAIVNGNQDAATQYLKQKTYSSLYSAFEPKINNALTQVGAQQLWNQVFSQYNQLPLVPPVPDNLSAHTTSKALDGVFYYVGVEEGKIRANPGAYLNDLLTKVFKK